MTLWRPAVALLLAARVVSAQDPATSPPTRWAAARDLTELSLSELASMKVVSVSKKPESRSRTAAAIHVITAEDIRRSGLTTLPDLLRLAPGVHVARINSNQWGIGIRGFTSRLARGQLALIDGRSLYTPLFAGTYWEVQDLMLEDVDRIEVVRGPGGTLWGANAVTGIVNVITKSSRDTTGGLAAVGGGSEERAFARARYGGALGTRGHYRVYAKYVDRDASFHSDGVDYDDWHMLTGGFRTDWNLRAGDVLTVQGDAYSARVGERTSVSSYSAPYTTLVEQDAPLSGGNLRSRWTRTLAGGSELSVQAYYDRTHRQEPSFEETRNTFDLDAQYRFRLGSRHEVVLGAGYRASDGRSTGIETLSFEPPDKTDNLASAFVQDEVRLAADRLLLTIGTKVEDNDYTGAEFQPSARIVFAPGGRHSVWASVTRAVRTPSRIDREVALTIAFPGADVPLFARVLGSSAFDTERLYAYEGGYRVQLSERAMLDLALFYNRFPNLTSLEPGAPFPEPGRQVVPYVFGNGLQANVAGAELSSDVRLSKSWTVRGSYSYLDMDLTTRPGSADTTSAAAEGASPRHRAMIWSSWALPGGLDLDLRFRHVSRLPSQNVPAWTALDVRAAWRPSPRLELAATGQNLLDPHHPEFGGGSEIQRSVHAEAIWHF
jgi:iron complex outermembrane receptor protein